MNKFQKTLSAALAAPLLACGSATTIGDAKAPEDPKTPSETNFKAALSQYLEKKGDLCLEIYQWPVVVSGLEMKSKDTILGDKFNQMEALASVGLVRSEDKNGARGYFTTDAAKPFLQEPVLCWGKKVPDKVVKWDGPVALGSYQEVKVTYTYKIDALAEWAKNPSIQKAFPNIKTTMDNASKSENQHALKLTNQGWEALGLNSKW